MIEKVDTFRIGPNFVIFSRMIAVIFLLLIFMFLRFSFDARLLNIDENIVLSVSASMVSRGDFNANWRLADGIMPYFQYDMHNFYSYHLLSMLFLGEDSNISIANLRNLNVAMQFLSMLFFWFALKNGGVHFWRRMAVMVALAVLPTMVFDAHIARTESFLYLLLSAVILVASINISNPSRWLFVGFIVGVGVASKVTFASVFLIFIPEAIRLFRHSPSRFGVHVCVAFASVVVGFAATAPYSILEPNVLINGLKQLIQQYSTEHLPHSNPGSGISDWFMHLAIFSIGITGGSCLFIFFKRENYPDWLVGISIFSGAVLLYFATKPVFFERNIGIALMGCVLVAFTVNRSVFLNSCLVISIFVMSYWSFNIAMASARPAGFYVRAWEVKTFGEAVSRHEWPVTNASKLLGSCDDLFIGAIDYRDRTSQRIKEEIGVPQSNYYVGLFYPLPTSTLDTYLDTSIGYYSCK